MIERISELPIWGPEEQLRKFVNQHDITDEQEVSQQVITQRRIQNLDDIFQKQLIWSYGKEGVSEAYFYWDWCPVGLVDDVDPMWHILRWPEWQENLDRDIDRTFDYRSFVGYTNRENEDDELPIDYDSRTDVHAKDTADDSQAQDTLDIEVLRHNIMNSWLEVSEWLGDGATYYGSKNGYVSRKMSMCWLFDSIRALINWKLRHKDGEGEVDIHPLDGGTYNKETQQWTYNKDSSGNNICERFLNSGEKSTQGIEYDDEISLDQSQGCCDVQSKKRARNPDKDGVSITRGNEFHYGERAWFYTHNSFIGECRFFHNTRFLGQATFDKEINGTAMRTRWADLAEYKEADKPYKEGTLVMFGGEKEITISDGKTVHAIVTSNPGLILNGDTQLDKTMVGIALTGTVPVKVAGKVKKFDKLVASSKCPGFAESRKWWQFWKRPIGIALDNWPTDVVGGLINCVTRMEF